jgi:aminopeptidase N
MRIPALLPCTLLATLLALPALLPAQRYDPLHPPNTYRNADNPHYWKNRPPFEGYWQQDVHYRINARLDERDDAIDGSLELVYWNNSPDTLRHIFLHLYQNAYNAGSYADLMQNGRPTPGDTVQRGTTITDLRAEGRPLRTELDNTVLKAWLEEPLPPGGRMRFTCTFRTHWDAGMYRRMKLFNAWGFKHYDGVHWYPRIAVYDRRFGWDTQQHLGNELYGDFGTYDVALDMPNDMVVEATGWLQNPTEVMPPDLRRRLDLANFKDKPWNERPGVITPYDSTVRKVWRYHAENVHDFAFTADPTYRIGETLWNGVKCVALVQEPHASGWQNAADYCAKAVRVHSEQIGMYLYPKMVVADARDGMEYPMLTLDGGRDPDYRGLFMHEIGHNWFYGMVGNNETYRAMLDEGFTQFLTSWGLEHVDGDTLVEDPPKGAYVRRYTKPTLVRESEVYQGYMRDAVRDELPPINTHSDAFAHVEGRGGGYGHVYYKTATMLYNLQYVLGDSVFLAAMRAYFDRWKLCHPYEEDFRTSVLQSTGADLNWFFDQWIGTDKRIDYAVVGVKHRNRDSGQVIKLRRKGSMEMPLDLRVTARDGRHYDLHIPNTWYTKPTTATVLPRWIGWDDLQRDHAVQVDIPSGIADVRIDTSYRLADAYQLDNSLQPPVDLTFDHHVANPPDRRMYEAFGRPDLWWNGYDGLKLGVHFHGDHLRYKHKLWFSAWVNTGFLQHLPSSNSAASFDPVPDNRDTRYDPFSFNFRYENGTERILKGSSVNVHARLLDGLEQYGAGFKWRTTDERTELYSDVKFLLRRDSSDLTYLNYPDEWELDALNSAWDNGVRHRYTYGRSEGRITFNVRSSTIGSAMGYAQATLTAVNENRLGDWLLRTRFLGQYGTGNTPRESRLFLAGATPEAYMDDKFVRSIGFVPYDWLGHGAGVNHFQQGGGLNLRGYAGYLAPEGSGADQVLTYSGNTGISASAELDLDGLVRWRPRPIARTLHLDAYLFGDVGAMGYRTTTADGQRLELARPRADAGAGIALTIKRWGPLVDIKPFTIRFDMPLFLSALPAGEDEHFAFRYVVGIGRSF